MATAREIAKVLAVLSAAYPAYGQGRADDVNNAAMALYQKLLADIPADVLGVAAEQHIASSKWFPAVAELREQAAKLRTPQLAERTPDEAWGDVRRATLDYYPYADHCYAPEIADPIAAAIVRDMGGLHYLFASENEMSDRAQFIKAYEARSRRARDESLLLPQARAMRQLNGGEPVGDPALFGKVTELVKKLADGKRG